VVGDEQKGEEEGLYRGRSTLCICTVKIFIWRRRRRRRRGIT
jgi:hypothetical protein